MGASISTFSKSDAAAADETATPQETPAPADGAPAPAAEEDGKASAEAEADAVVDAAAAAVQSSDELHGTLHVTLRRAEGVENIALQGDMNLAVKSTFLGQSFKSPAVQGSGSDAEFEYTFTLPLDGVLGTMFVEVSHEEGLQSNTVGFGDVPVADLAKAAEPRAWDITRDGETSVGKVYFSSRFEPSPAAH